MAPEDDTEEHEERAEERTAEERTGEREERTLRAGSTWEREREPERGGTSDRPVGRSQQRSGYGQASETYGDRYVSGVESGSGQGRPSGPGGTERARLETTDSGGDETDRGEDEARTERREGERQEEREGGEQREEVPRYGGRLESTRQSRGRWGRNENELRAYERRIDRAIARQCDLQRDKSGQPYHRGRR
ncbi:hypothetical protein [Halomicrococcus gelatinilyticus]|uniref:hypothetical protein n=1 Tax=Halomicrococcus gelatinilyticus TaxID=1702103 RepID=UPI002E127055